MSEASFGLSAVVCLKTYTRRVVFCRWRYALPTHVNSASAMPHVSADMQLRVDTASCLRIAWQGFQMHREHF
jgi:hypothetical protein